MTLVERISALATAVAAHFKLVTAARGAVIDFGASPVASGEFVITDADAQPAHFVTVFVAPETTPDNDADAHRMAALSFRFSVLAGNGTIAVSAASVLFLATGSFKIRYRLS